MPNGLGTPIPQSPNTQIHELDATGKIALNPMIQSSNWVPNKCGYMSWTQLARVRIGYHRRRIHGLDATGKVALNPIIQSSDRVPPKADTWTGCNWQGCAQSNNPEFGTGTTEGGYMDWAQLARYYRKWIHGLDTTGKVAPNPIIQSSDWVPPHEWDATGQVVIQYSGSLMASVAEPLYPKSGPHFRARNTNVKQVETNPRSVRNTGVNSGPFLRLVCLRTAYIHNLPGADSSSSPSRHDEGWSVAQGFSRGSLFLGRSKAESSNPMGSFALALEAGRFLGHAD
ncbi:hypothetical protein B0H13DRAFT_1855476 [Mycena leptocephala]|nr:hypothetical protein B0H13DRAFT_1855476 [Mycena leptocephala]